MVNLVVRLPGRRTDRILFTGHYDTKLMRDRPFVGANDGASSAAFLIELARVLEARPRDVHLRTGLVRRRRGLLRRVGRVRPARRPRQHLRQPPLRAGGAEGRCPGHHQGHDPRRHDRRPRPRAAPRCEVDAMADRVDLEPRPAASAYDHVFVDASTAGRGRPPGVSGRRHPVGRSDRSRTIPTGTRRTTRSTT